MRDDTRFAGTSRFEVVRELGAGGMGVVYEARDRERNAVVALKRIKRFDAKGLLRFKKEFRALHDLSHPNLVGLGELFEDHGDWFFTMELVRGVDFIRWVRGNVSNNADVPLSDGLGGASTMSAPTSAVPRRADGPAPASGETYDEAKLRTALKGLARGISVIHEAGRVHRDIKPSNILVTSSGRAVLLDFGLIANVSPGPPSESEVVGTAEYMAPEQAIGGDVRPPADWYSLGVVLYEALTGRLPHSGKTALELMMTKQQRTPPPPRAWDAGVPTDLDELCVDLLQLDPAKRPSSAEILTRLGVEDSVEATWRGAASSSISLSAPFVGREQQLTSLRAAFDRSQLAAQILIVEGESGLGKSQLVEHFTRSLSDEIPDLVVLASRCYERETVVYKAFDGVADALSRYMSRLSNEEATALLPLEAGLLPQLFQVLHRVEAITRAPRETELPDPLEQRQRMFRALRELFSRLVKRHPVILCIDDLQWADADSLALLQALLADEAAPKLLLLATMRPATDDHRAAILAKVQSYAATERMLLTELDTATARDLAARLVPRADEAALDLIARSTGGHPLFIHELAKHIGQETSRALSTLEEALAARVRLLSSEARTLLDIVCVAGSPISHEVAAAAAELDPSDHAKAVRTLRAAHLVRTDGVRSADTIVAFHDRIRVFVTDSINGEQEKGIHERLAIALERSGAGRHDPHSLVRHAMAAGDHKAAAHHALAAAADAERALAFGRAADLYAAALSIGEHEDNTARDLSFKMANALVGAGRCAEAAEAFIAAASGAENSLRLDCQRQAAEQWLISGHIERGLGAMEGLLGEIGESMPASPTRALLSVLKNRLRTRLRGLKWTERPPSEIPSATLTRIDVLKAVSHGLSMVDNIRGADFNARYLRLALRTGEIRRIAGALGTEAVFRGSQGTAGCVEARRLVDKISQIAARVPDDPYLPAWATCIDGIVAYFEGRFVAGEKLLAAAEASFVRDTRGTTYERNNTRLFRMFCLRYMGELAKASQLSGGYIRDAIQRGDYFAGTTLRRYAVRYMHLIADTPDDACAELEKANWTPPGKDFHLQHWYQLDAEAELALYERNAQQRLDALLLQFDKLHKSLLLRVRTVRVAAHSLRARLLLGASNNSAGHQSMVGKLVRRLEREKIAYATVFALLLKAAKPTPDWRVAAEQRREWLHEAVHLAEQSDMRFHAEAARYRLGGLIGGTEGEQMMAAASTWMKSQKIKRPERMLEVIAPGY